MSPAMTGASRDHVAIALVEDFGRTRMAGQVRMMGNPYRHVLNLPTLRRYP